jgi:hypothetical protein
VEQWPLQNIYSMELHASTPVEHRSTTRNSDVRSPWCVQLCHATWKQWAILITSWVCSWCHYPRPSGLKSLYPGLHLMIFRVHRPNCEAYQVGFWFCSRVTLGWRSYKKKLTSDDKTGHWDHFDLTQKNRGVILEIIEISQVQKSQTFVLNPLVHTPRCLVKFRASSPKMGTFS